MKKTNFHCVRFIALDSFFEALDSFLDSFFEADFRQILEIFGGIAHKDLRMLCPS
jgi:hypothetical protein